ncbi:MAG: cation transporter [Clostridiales Family XIII bacterium]|jgi:copper chaperone|nr:cation transporter [Clostridiales Family XIII bacterium]
MEKTIINVSGMSCEHCVRAVTTAVNALPGIGGVAVDLAAGTVAVEYDPAQSPLDKIKAGIADQGFGVA